MSTFSCDPTLDPPPSYTVSRANEVYGEAFRRVFEYIRGTKITGDILEFGTFKGYTARLIATLIKEFNCQSHLYLFDSFEGLPEALDPVDKTSYEIAVNKVWSQGSMKPQEGVEILIERALLEIIPRSQLTIVKGFFEETLEQNLPTEGKAAIINVDCDLYSSARCVMDKLLEKNLLQDGCVIMFDDFNCNRARPDMGERRVFSETFAVEDGHYNCSEFFSYGWHGKAFFVHDKNKQPKA